MVEAAFMETDVSITARVGSKARVGINSSCIEMRSTDERRSPEMPSGMGWLYVLASGPNVQLRGFSGGANDLG